MTDPGPIARRLLSLFWPRGEPILRLRVVAAIALLVVGKLVSIGAPLVYKQIIDAFSVEAIVIVPVALILAYGVANIAAQMTGDLRQLVFVSVAQRAIRLTALEVFRHLHRLSMRFHIERQTGGLSRIVERGTASIEFLLELVLFSILPTVLELVLVCAILWRFYSLDFALVTLAGIGAYAAFTAIITRRQVHLRRDMNQRDVVASVKATDSILNYETVKYFGAERHEADGYETAKRAYERAAIRSQSMQSLLTIGQTVIISAGSVAVMLMAGRGVVSGAMTVGDFVLVNAYLLQLYAPLNLLGMVYSSVRQSVTDIEAMGNLLHQPVEVEDAPRAAALIVRRGHVRFDRVSFGYDPRRPILKDVSFDIPPGGTVALVGPTGGGKSTIGRLLFRFYDVGDGCITIDGQDVREITQESLRRVIGVVPQDTVLFNDTIYYNIAYGRTGASRDEVEHAARSASIHDFIRSLPDGYDSQVGERGLKLSGGEKQRIAIARVILKQPSILVFDEATSALDSRTEREIQASLRAVSAERSTLIIAHRLSTIVDADDILVIDHGRIVERGRHEHLLAQGGVYAAMWSRQKREAAAGRLDIAPVP
ncbi:ABC transporter ATP-binding protein/permease [Brevundimonas sp.]|uniref:ABCB family ABC transporter ATP-binding protein/permease n=1 Tax=Brevundimonas sp. TaxID=1871086 RepID=UPI002D334EB8|nr:ABC transporter ATP-binding protein/permease [Brevundimonas sp.]HYC99258.1 ABC transporter ATP-binding protein/permease [Brevundimonas sp.]